MAQNSDSIAARLDTQRYYFPQEKIHVTTDQTRYVAGDTVWLRAWVVDAASHQQVAASRYVYVELRSPMNEVYERIKLLQSGNGTFSGFIPTEIDTPEGEYTLSAYTAFMENLGPDYFFSKSLGIVSPYSSKARLETEAVRTGNNVELSVLLTDDNAQPLEYSNLSVKMPSGDFVERSRGQGRQRITFNSDKLTTPVVLVKVDNYEKYVTIPDNDKNISVTFHPEGGYMIPGTASRIGIKAINSYGRGINVEGVIVDDLKQEIARFATTHLGMGEVSIMAQPDVKYTAIIGEQAIELPVARADAAVLHVDNSRAASVNVSAVGAVPENAWVLAQSRGRYLFSEVVPTNSAQLRIPRDQLPGGIVQFILFTADGQPLSERIIFVYPHNEINISTASSAISSDSTVVTLSLPKGSFGDVAIAVHVPGAAEADSVNTIASQLLLQSELRGYIEDPGYYFRQPSKQTAVDLDALMLTQGWSRYDIPAVIADRYAEPTEPIEKGAVVTGTIKSRWKGTPLPNAEINVLVPTLGYGDYAVTDSLGHFCIDGFEFPDGTTFIAQALNSKGKNEQNFAFDTPSFPLITPIVPRPQSPIDAAENANYAYRINQFNGTMWVTLGEVTVSAGYKPGADLSEQIASSSIYTDRLDEKIDTYEEALRQIPGVNVLEGSARYRGKRISLWVDGSPFSAQYGAAWQFENSSSYNSKAELGVDIPYSNPMSLTNGVMVSHARRMRVMKQIFQYVDATNPSTYSSKSDEIAQLESMYPFEAIKRIDLLLPTQASIFTGNAYYSPGLIMLTTKNPADYHGKLPWQLKTVQPLGYQRRKETYSPRYPHIPLAYPGNGTLLWIPSMPIDDAATARLYVPTNTRIVAEGITVDGQPFSVCRNVD